MEMKMSRWDKINGGYIACLYVIFTLLGMSAVAWAAGSFVPEAGWWILLKFWVSVCKFALPILAAYFALGALLIWVGSKVLTPVSKTDLPFWCLIGAALVGKVGFLVMILAGIQFDHPWFFPVLSAIAAVVFGLPLVGLFFQGKVRPMPYNGLPTDFVFKPNRPVRL